MSTATMIVGDVRDVLATIPDGSVDLVLSSPPFWALRSYLAADDPDKHREIGAESSPGEYLRTQLELAQEYRRVLAPHGSLVYEIGDTYAGSGGAGGDYNEGGFRDGQVGAARRTRLNRSSVPLDKSMCGIPTLFAWSLAYGRNLLAPEQTFAPWRIRNLIAWCRPNPPVGALGDKWRPATSYITVACVGARRWFDLDAVRTEHKSDPAKYSGNGYSKSSPAGIPGNESMPGPAGAPPLDWYSEIDDGPNGDRLWIMNTAPYPGSHYATFPPELPRRIIESMCPRQVCTICGTPSTRIVEATEDYASRPFAGRDFRLNRNGDRGLNDTRNSDRPTAAFVTLGWTDCGCSTDGTPHWRNGLVLDPFGGSGTTGAVATGLGRDCTLIDLDGRNIDLARDRIGMFLDVDDRRAGVA